MNRVPDILLDIVAQRRRRLGISGAVLPATPGSGVGGEILDVVSHPFLRALRAPGRSIIGEVKLGSPRLGDRRGAIDPERQAELYAEAGASALSVVVEPDFFFGSYELLERCRRASGLPTIAKDFVVDPSQLDAAVAAGAQAVLLIAALFDAGGLRAFASAARERGLAPLIETHGAEDVAVLGDAPWELVGVNNRDLRTFEVDLSHAERLRPCLPDGCVAVAESGLSTATDVERLASAGFDAFLVGESLLLSPDPASTLRHLAGIESEAGG